MKKRRSALPDTGKSHAENARKAKKNLRPRSAQRWFLAAGFLFAAVVALFLQRMERAGGRPPGTGELNNVHTGTAHSERRPRTEYAVFGAPSFAKDHSFNSEAVLVWGGSHQFTEGLRHNEALSNIRRGDYAGPDACRECHLEKYQHWSDHSHRWMNATADERSVKGDFSGGKKSQIEYRKGTVDFYRRQGNFMMKLTRDGIAREFKIRRTLGSRVHQYYIGVLQEGPEQDDHPLRTTDHVLPFGYELTMQEWIPIVHATGNHGPDEARDDPFEIPSRLPYDTSCSMCHTTPPMGNLMLAMFKRFAAYSPRKIHFEGSNYIDEMHPGTVRLGLAKSERFTRYNLKHHVNDLAEQSQHLMREANAVSLGIACEACHLGAKAHATNPKVRPPFFPSGPYVFASGSSDEDVWGRNAANKNFICARCHSGERPQFAAGMATWNSTEYTDAMRGHCYDPARAASQEMESLTCVACHDPHETIGRRWTQSAATDRDRCLKCHTRYRDQSALQQHTHHSLGSSGSECMNCHMPKINEGLGDMVRTHTIFSPTNKKMLEANQPNACNMCHVEKPIDWTYEYLSKWYGLSLSDGAANHASKGSHSNTAVEKNYNDHTQSVALGWLQSSHSATRMVGADVLLKNRATWALPQLLDMLDDPYLEIRQFTMQRLRENFDIDPEEYGYRIYMTADERKSPLQELSKSNRFRQKAR